MDKRCCGYKRRMEAMVKTLKLLEERVKQNLNLEREIHIQDYDGLVGHITIVMTRYIFLAIEQRNHGDPRTLGSLFHACCDEIADVSLLEAMQRLLTLIMDTIRSTGEFSENIISSLIDAVMGMAIDILNSHRACSAVLNGKTTN